MVKEDDFGGWQIPRSKQKWRPKQVRTSYEEAVRGRKRWDEMEKKSHTVFVDNLPHDVSKGMLFKMFGWAGSVLDVFISRKKRRESLYPFAFVRFDAIGGAERAVNEMDGVYVKSKRIMVSHAMFKRVSSEQKRRGVSKRIQSEGVNVALGATKSKEGATDQHRGKVKVLEDQRQEDRAANENRKSKRKVVDVEVSSTQTERLKRSIVGGTVHPIKFSNMMQ
ncbi:uncharacterized protein LOC107607049 [Arachis ipaensis]|uniref:uncharacterized protein LOC107607049 n=1 Tax=Arachis ipaensis TaxID=130454 RepID=UPI0007AFB379|nr:uncharacterized protein LOC107607049 [Arachis ipaensis]XP_025664727.1 uncharacterized protein LOC112763213 [Arachis hypogaea]